MISLEIEILITGYALGIILLIREFI